MQHAHDRSTAAKCTPVSVGVSGILLVLASCTGVVPADGFDEYKGGGGGGGGEGGAGGGGTRVEDSCSTDRPSAGAANWRRLTSVQYKNTIKDLLGLDADVNLFLSDTTTGHFLTNVGTATPDPQILKYQDTAGKLAAEAVRDLEKLMGCKASTGEDACALRFFNDFGARALRRPLTDVDLKLFDSVYRIGKQEGFATGVRLTVEAILQSPSFLYLVETGGAASNGVAAFDAYEMASRLSYVLWNTMPDAELTKAARDGSLNNLDGLRKEAQRLMNSPRFLDTLFAFHEQLFGVDKLGKQGGVVRDLKRYPAWSAVLTTAMRDETRQFVASVFSKGDGTLKELLTAPYGFPTGPLVAFYGSGQSVGSDGKFMFPDGSRRGILTQAATLSSAVPFDSLYRAVLRGKLLREQIFCEVLPTIPGNVMFKERPGADKMTQQELLRVHQEDPSCKACHERMDPLGFAFENFDGIGHHRKLAEDGNPVDTSGLVVGTDVEGPFSNTEGLIEKLANSNDVRGCFAQQWFKFTLGREAEDADACSLAQSRDVLAKGGGDLREALTLLVTSDSFRYRGGL